MIFVVKTVKPLSTGLLRVHNLHSSPRSLVSNPLAASKLLSSYFKLGRIEDAKKLFEEIPERNVVAWSIMIYGYATNGYHRESTKLFSKMRVSTTYPNSFTMVALLVNSVSLQNLEFGQSVHGVIVKFGLESDDIVGTAVLNMYSKCCNVVDSYKIFQQMNNPGLVSCNAMVAGFVYNQLCEEALVLFSRCRHYGLAPNSVTLLSVICGCSALESDRLCGSIHGFVFKTGHCLDLPVINAIQDMYATLGDLEAATKIFENILSKDIVSWTTIIGLLIRLEYACKALELFRRMREDVVNLDKVILVNLLTACGVLGDLNKGKSTHTQVVIRGVDSELHIANSIIAMYSKCGDLCSSRTIFNRMEEKSLVSWTTMISGCAQNGRPREALDLLIKMREKEDYYKLDPAILVSLLVACGELAALEPCQQLHCYLYKAGYPQLNSVQNSLISSYSKCGNVEFAHTVFEEIVCRDIVSWNAIISGYGINGCGEVAVALFRKMGSVGLEPDDVTYLSVLNACSHSGLVDDGLIIIEHLMKEKKFMLSGEHYGCVVDMLARSGRLSDASKFVSKLTTEKVGPNVWRALLGGCRIYNSVELAQLAADRVSHLDVEESGQIVLLSNVYASIGRFEEAENLRSDMTVKGLMKDPGISLLDQVREILVR